MTSRTPIERKWLGAMDTMAFGQGAFYSASQKTFSPTVWQKGAWAAGPAFKAWYAFVSAKPTLPPAVCREELRRELYPWGWTEGGLGDSFNPLCRGGASGGVNTSTAIRLKAGFAFRRKLGVIGQPYHAGNLATSGGLAQLPGVRNIAKEDGNANHDPSPSLGGWRIPPITSGHSWCKARRQLTDNPGRAPRRITNSPGD